jgi:hypothetical protein
MVRILQMQLYPIQEHDESRSAKSCNERRTCVTIPQSLAWGLKPETLKIGLEK